MRSILLSVFTLVLASTACQPPVQEAGPLSDEDVAAINDLAQRWAQLEKAGDWAGVAALHTDDAVWMPPNENIVEGPAAMRAWAEEGEVNVLELSSSIAEIDGRGDLAYLRASYTWTFEAAGLEEPITDVGKWVAVLRKQPDGSWKVAVNIWNSDQPLPEQGTETET
jgi:ketosteroid isomerase-like protein